MCGTTASLDSNSGNIASYNSKRVTTTTVWDGQPYQCLQEVLQWNIARDAPMEYCVQQIATNKRKWATVIIGRNQQRGMVCDNGVLRGMPVLRVTTPEPTQR